MTTPETYTTVDIVAGVTVDIGRAPTPKGMQAGPPPLMVRIHGPDYPDGWFEAESDWSSVQLATVLSNRYIPSDVACACYEAGWRAEKARADAAEKRARARELDMHEAQGLAWRLRREIRVFDSAQMTAMFGGAWREVEAIASLIRDEWDPWDFGDEPTTDRSRLREVHDHLTAHGLPALDRLDAEDVP